MAASYKSDVLATLVRNHLDREGHGAGVRLAAAMDVTPQTVTKWHKGEVQPEVWRWGALEQELGLPEGEIARLVLPVVSGDTVLELVLRVTEMVEDLASRVAALESPARAARRGR